MKTKTSSRSAKKKPSTAAARGRGAKTSAKKSPKKTSTATAKKPAARATAATSIADKYRQSGAPWWKAFL